MAPQEHNQVEEPAAGAWTPYEDGGNDPDFFIPADAPGHLSVRAMLRGWFSRVD